MMKKFKQILAIISVAFAVCTVVLFKQTFPGMGLPLIGLYWINPSSPSENGSPYKYYYEELSPIEKHAYNRILDEIYEMPESIKIPSLSETQLDNVFSALLYDNPDLIFAGRKCSISDVLWCHFFSMEYICTKEEYLKEKAELDLECRDIIANLTDIEDKWQTELEIHNYIIDHCSYKMVKKEYIYSSAYGCLINGKAACEGYSKAAKMLFDMVGIDNVLVSGLSQGRETGQHMWNMVKIDNNYYHLDVTWDDPLSGSGKNMRLYSYFNVSDEVIKEDHLDFSIDIPCNSMDENYYTKTGTFFNVYSRDNEAKLVEMIVDGYKSGNTQIQFRYTNEEAYNSAHRDLIINNRIAVIIRKAAETAGEGLLKQSVGYTENSDLYTLTILL